MAGVLWCRFLFYFLNSFCFSVCPKPKRTVFDWDVCEIGILQEKEKVLKNTLKTTTTNTFPVMGYPACMHWRRQVEKGREHVWRLSLCQVLAGAGLKRRCRESDCPLKALFLSFFFDLTVQSKWLPIKGPVSVFCGF